MSIRGTPKPLDFRSGVPARAGGQTSGTCRSGSARPVRPRPAARPAPGGFETAHASPPAAREDPDSQHQPEPRIHDEQHIAVIPVAARRHEPAHAVGVEGVEEGMGEDRTGPRAAAPRAARRRRARPRGPSGERSARRSRPPVRRNGSTTSAGIPWVQPRRKARSAAGPSR